MADVLHPLSKGSLQASAELQGVAADLDNVVDKSAHGRQGKRRGEEHHIAELDEHFLVILERVLSDSNMIKQDKYLHKHSVEILDPGDILVVQTYLIRLHTALNLSLGQSDSFGLLWGVDP